MENRNGTTSGKDEFLRWIGQEVGQAEKNKNIRNCSTGGCNLPVFVSTVCLPITVTTRWLFV